MSDLVSTRRHVLIVEDEAHISVGHFPVLFAETATALADLGCGVTALTAEGWALDDPANPPRFALRRLDGLAGYAYRLAMRLGRRFPARAVQVVKRLVCDVALTVRAGRLAKGLGADVIMLGYRPRPYGVLLAANARRWIVMQWFPNARGGAAWTDRLGLARLVVAAERIRRRCGGATMLAVNTERDLESWGSALPGSEVRRLWVTGARSTTPQPDVRERLGLPQGARFALIFGADHGAKDLPPVLELFAGWEAEGVAPEWHLLAGGGAGTFAENWQGQHGVQLARVHVFPGFVSEQVRNDLHDAADVVILSFHPGWSADSGTLADAVAWGKPVVCSDNCGPAVIARSLGIGTFFESGSMRSLGEALQSSPQQLDDDVLRHARAEYSMRSVAERYLALFDEMAR